MVQIFNKGLAGKIAGIFGKKKADEADFMEILSADQITPVDKPISARRAVEVYREYMLKTGYLDKSDLPDFTRSFKEAMKEREEELKNEVKLLKYQVADAKAEVKQCKKALAKCRDDDDREYAQQDLAEAEAELAEEQNNFEKYSRQLEQFKKDKREFLLECITSEIHGDDWSVRDTQKKTG